jgi:hypothetical protein
MWKWGTFLNNKESVPVKFEEAGGGWVDIKCSVFSAIGIKSNGAVYTWGINEFGNLALGAGSNISQPIPYFSQITPILEEDRKSNRNVVSIETSDYTDLASGQTGSTENRIGSFSTIVSKYDISEKEYEESDFIYVLNINRDRYKDSIKPGTWQLSLIGVDTNNMPLTGSFPITLIDDSNLSNYNVDKKDVYNVYSGSLIDGFYTGSFSVPYGLFYPNHGIIVLNGRSLYSFNSIFTNRIRPHEDIIFQKYRTEER